MPVLDALRCVHVKKISRGDVHNHKINSMKQIKVEEKKFSLQGFITSGDDKTVKIWNRNGELWGSIDLLREIVKRNDWKFPT
jgi:hypothetical protein